LKESNSHFAQTIIENPFVTIPRYKPTKKPESTNVLSSTFAPQQMESSVQKQIKNQKEEIKNPLTASMCYCE